MRLAGWEVDLGRVARRFSLETECLIPSMRPEGTMAIFTSPPLSAPSRSHLDCRGREEGREGGRERRREEGRQRERGKREREREGAGGREGAKETRSTCCRSGRS